MNIQKMMKQAQELQNKIGEVQARLEQEESEGSSGGGMVKVTMNGKGHALSLTVDESLVKVEDKDMLEDLIIAAFNDAKTRAETHFSEEMGKVTAGLPLPAGMKLPF